MFESTDWSPDPYIVVLTGMGFLIALVAWLPIALKRLPLSLPIVWIALGAGLFVIPQVSDEPLPVAYPEFTERFTEFVVIIALMGAGLKLDRVFNWRRWAVTWRLLAITMPLSILAITVLGAWFIGLPWFVALLLAASLAPTDPVLAADVQVGPPKSGKEDEVRFGLTSEAGLNDGLAFPFVNLAIALGLAATSGKPWLFDLLTHSVLWEMRANANHDRAQDDDAEYAPEQHPVLVLPRHGEEPEDQRDHEDVVERQAFLDDEAGQILDACCLAELPPYRPQSAHPENGERWQLFAAKVKPFIKQNDIFTYIYFLIPSVSSTYGRVLTILAKRDD